jgi:hypothetical protein
MESHSKISGTIFCLIMLIITVPIFVFHLIGAVKKHPELEELPFTQGVLTKVYPCDKYISRRQTMLSIDIESAGKESTIRIPCIQHKLRVLKINKGNDISIHYYKKQAWHVAFKFKRGIYIKYSEKLKSHISTSTFLMFIFGFLVLTFVYFLHSVWRKPKTKSSKLGMAHRKHRAIKTTNRYKRTKLGKSQRNKMKIKRYRKKKAPHNL